METRGSGLTAGIQEMTAPTENRLTIIALARSEAKHLGPCFKSLQTLTSQLGVNTLIVLDSRADQATETVARTVADRVLVSEFVNFSVQRNRGLDAAQTEWVFFIDPDERCTPALAQEVAKAIGQDEYAAFRVPRRNILFGHEVHHTGWWPDYQVRLLKRDCCRYDETRQVHELPIVFGKTGALTEPLIHYNYKTWRQFVKKQWAYAKYDARALYVSGRRARLRNMLGQPLRELKRRLVDYEGYKDGLLGVALSLAMGLYVAETYRQLWRLQRRVG